MRSEYPLEFEEQAAYFRHIEQMVKTGQWPAEMLLTYANINEQKFGPGETKIGRIKRLKKLKAQGHKTGVPDSTTPIPRYPYHGLYIEFKSRDPNAPVSPDQRHYIDSLNRLGYLARLCYGSDEAIELAELYLKLPKWKNPEVCY